MATGDVKRKLTAIFSADVEGYSRLMEEDELATIETLTSHKEIMRKLIRQYRGRVVDSTGDNLLAQFASVVDAVQCAVEVQQVLSSKNEALPENRRMYFRIGINLGDVVEEGERIFGDGVNVAARVESLAGGGGISISGTAFDQLGKKLPLGYEYLGEQSVKNIRKPVRVYRVLTEAEAVGKVIGEEKLKPTPWRWPAAAIAIVILAVAALAIWNFYFRPAFEPASVDRMAYPLPDKPSIAVLAFDNMSGDPKQEYFSDGITEGIITALSSVPELFVIARNSSFSYKGKPVNVKQVAEELGVHYVLEGSVQKSDDKVRITVQLIDALKGHHLWAESYDRNLEDIFALQDEITMKIITELRVKLVGEQARLAAPCTTNLKAYLKYLEANEHLYRWNKEDNLVAQRLAEDAIALEPEYACAYSLLGGTHLLEVVFRSSTSPKQSIAKAKENIGKAIALNPSLSGPHSMLALVFSAIGQYEKSIEQAEKALAVDPNSIFSLRQLGASLRFAGRSDEAIPIYEKVIRSDPFSTANYFSLGMCYLFTGQWEDAIRICKRATERNPKDLFAHLCLTSAYSAAGREEEA
ncbi:MAG: adenylate/guanylate cyclase domain-containing protein, partial [Desulfobacteraceae bacterium]